MLTYYAYLRLLLPYDLSGLIIAKNQYLFEEPVALI